MTDDIEKKEKELLEDITVVDMSNENDIEFNDQEEVGLNQDDFADAAIYVAEDLAAEDQDDASMSSEDQADAGMSSEDQADAGMSSEDQADAGMSKQDSKSSDDIEFNNQEDVEREDLVLGAEVKSADVNEQEPQQQLLRLEEALNIEGQVEAVIFSSPKPLKPAEILDIVQNEEGDVELKDIVTTIDGLVQWYRERAGGFTLVSLKGEGYQFQTVPAAIPLMEKFFSDRPRSLSRAALETLSIIAYRQPVTRADIEYIRSVDAGSIIKNLMDRDLIECVGRKEDAGRPMIFGTTAEFLKVFRLASIKDLPPLSAFQAAPDVVADASEKIEGEREVGIEGFIGDPDQMVPEVSSGVGAGPDTEGGGALAQPFTEDNGDLSEEEINSGKDTALLAHTSGQISQKELEGAVKSKSSLDSKDDVVFWNDLEMGAEKEGSDNSDGKDAHSEVVVDEGDSLPKRS